jgi:hypothetical protein
MNMSNREAIAEKFENRAALVAFGVALLDVFSVLRLAVGPWETIGGLIILAIFQAPRIWGPQVVMRSRAVGANKAAVAVQAVMICTFAVSALMAGSAIFDVLRERAAEAVHRSAPAETARNDRARAEQRLRELEASAGDLTTLAGAQARANSIDSSVERATAQHVAELDALLASPAMNKAGKDAGVSVAAFMGSDCGNTNSRYAGLHALYVGRCQDIMSRMSAAAGEFKASRGEAAQQALLYQQILGARETLKRTEASVNQAGTGAAVENDGYPAFTQLFRPLFGLAWIQAEYTPAKAAWWFSLFVAGLMLAVAWKMAHGSAVFGVPVSRGGADDDSDSDSAITITGAIKSRLQSARENAALAIAGQSPAIASKSTAIARKPNPIGFMPSDDDESEPQSSLKFDNRNNRQQKYNMARASGMASHAAASAVGIPAGSASRFEARYKQAES